jgi:hypothetical protein
VKRRRLLPWRSLAAAATTAGVAVAIALAPAGGQDTPPAATAPRTLAVPAGGDLQAALERARPGDVIELEAGARYVGPFTLPAKTGSGWIAIQSSALGALPPGQRVGPAHAPHMPKLVAASGPVVVAMPGAHHYRVAGVEIHPVPGTHLTNLVELGTHARTLDSLPHDIVFDRCYLHGDPLKGARRGLALNARGATVRDSHLADFKDPRADSQAIAAWNGPGPFTIANNYLEAAGENVMFGGADPLIANLVPGDIEIRGNHFAKPLAWKAGEPGYGGTGWAVKNLLELKNARRVVVDGNLFEHNWEAGQSGFAILFTVRNQDGTAPWSVIEDVTFANNIVRRAAAGINILGRDDVRPSQPVRRIAVRNNLFEDLGGPRWGGPGTLLQILDGAEGVVIEHNTAFQAGSIIVAEGRAHGGFVYRGNIAPHNTYGVVGTGTGPGHATLRRYFPDAVFTGNVVAGGRAALYPPGNFFPGSLDEVGFANRAGGDYRLRDGRRYRGGMERDPGVDVRAMPPEVAGEPPRTPAAARRGVTP